MTPVANVEFRRYEVICNRYEVIRELGTGGMATVLLARDLMLERQVAIKLLRIDDPELRQRLFNEARISARCQHDNIVVVHHADVHNGWPYIVLEHLSGGTLSDLLRNIGTLPYARAVEIVVSVLRALQHMHARGIIHRDIKPDNIFLTAAGTIKVLDLGIAKLLERGPAQLGNPDPCTPQCHGGMVTSSELTRPGTILGTPAYMSPEQWIGKQIDHLTDLWACGILLFELICGRHPLYPRQGNQLIATAVLDMPMPSLATAAPRCVPHGLSTVVDRCLRKDKAERWQGAGELLAALLPYLPTRPANDVGLAANDAETVIVHAPPPPECPAAANSVPANEVLPPLLHISVPQATIVQPKSLLMVAAQAAGAGHGTVDRKTRAIREELERGIVRDRFKLVDCPAPEAHDVLSLLRKHRPILVYFVGGNQPTERCNGQGLFGKQGGLYLLHNGVPRLVAPTGLQEMFGAAGRSVKVVVLDSSYTELHAEALLAHVDVVMGTPGTARAELAEAYARGLFGALSDGESAATAHRHGCAAWRLLGQDDDECPQIKMRRGVDAGQLVLAR